MAKSYSVTEARAHLAKIVDEVEAGSEVELTRRGKTVAIIVSATKHARRKVVRIGFAEAYDRFARRFDLGKLGLDERWAAELRDRAVGRRVEL